MPAHETTGALSSSAPLPDFAQFATGDLIAEARRGSRDVWSEIYDRYRSFLVACVKARHHDLWAHDDVEDAIHDVFLKLQKRIVEHQYIDEAKFRPWLRTLILNRFADHWRSQGLRRAERIDTGVESSLADKSWEEDSLTKLVENKDELQNVYRALGALGDADRDAIIARICEKKDWAAIGELLGCKRTLAKKRFLRAWDRLNRVLEDGGRAEAQDQDQDQAP